MKITINTDILNKYNLSLEEFLPLLIGFYDFNYSKGLDTLESKKIIESNLFDPYGIVLSNNTKDLVASIITESDDKVQNSNIDFKSLASKLQDIYPEGTKPGTTYSWRGSLEEITQKLRILIATHNFSFTEEEAIQATKEYCNSFEDTTHMRLLRNFIFKTYQDDNDNKEIDSQFMTIIENNRNEYNT